MKRLQEIAVLSSSQSWYIRIWVIPIVPGKSEAWRRFAQEMLGTRRRAFETRCRQFQIHALRAWVVATVNGDVGVVAIVSSQPEREFPQFVPLDAPFDRWLYRQWQTLHGAYLPLEEMNLQTELVLDWQEKEGASS